MVNAANERLVRSIYATQYATAANGSMRHEIFAIVLPSIILKCAPFMPFPAVLAHANVSLLLEATYYHRPNTAFGTVNDDVPGLMYAHPKRGLCWRQSDRRRWTWLRPPFPLRASTSTARRA